MQSDQSIAVLELRVVGAEGAFEHESDLALVDVSADAWRLFLNLHSLLSELNVE